MSDTRINDRLAVDGGPPTIDREMNRYKGAAVIGDEEKAAESHGATAYQAARFYYLLHERKLVNAEQSEMMLSTLANPGIDHKFVRGLSQYKDLKIFRKSGSWKQYHADSALVESGDHSYIMVALIEDAGGGTWMEMLAPRLHELITEN